MVEPLSGIYFHAPPSYGSGRYGFGAFGAQNSVLCDRCSVETRHALDRFLKHLGSVLGWQNSVTRSGIPQIIRNENHHFQRRA